MKSLKKPSQILRKAASIINSDLKKGVYYRDGSCDAIERASGYYTSRAIDFPSVYRKNANRAHELFSSLFDNQKRNGGESGCYWFGPKFTNTQQEHRIMALLLTADMCESVGE